MFVIDQIRLVSTLTSGIFIIGLLFHWNLDILAWIIIKAVSIGLVFGLLVYFVIGQIEKFFKK